MSEEIDMNEQFRLVKASLLTVINHSPFLLEAHTAEEQLKFLTRIFEEWQSHRDKILELEKKVEKWKSYSGFLEDSLSYEQSRRDKIIQNLQAQLAEWEDEAKR